MDLNAIKRTGIAAAYNGGKILRSYFGNNPAIRKKGAIDLVTQADTEAEKVIVETIHARFPDHAILAEESGQIDGSSEADTENRWIIDPLDGTTNFAHELGFFSVSIAFEHAGDILVGIVLNPVGGELFSAISGKGAFLNDCPIKVTDTPSVSDSLLATGFPYDLPEVFPQLTARFSTCLMNAQGIRRIGSAALDLCYVACGRFDGFWEQDLHPWDTAAGLRIAAEAGATITDFTNLPFDIDKSEILATNGRIHPEMVDLLKIKDV